MNKKISLNLGGLKLGQASTSKSSAKESDFTNAEGFGSFGKKEKKIQFEPSEPSEPEVDIVVEKEPDLASVMGFSGFGDSKKAKQSWYIAC